jgi:hypothetical protein
VLPVVRVVVLVAFDQLFLRVPQQLDGLLGMPTELDALVGPLGIFDVMNRIPRLVMRIAEIRMTDFICQSDRRDERGRQRSNDNFLHNLPPR